MLQIESNCKYVAWSTFVWFLKRAIELKFVICHWETVLRQCSVISIDYVLQVQLNGSMYLFVAQMYPESRAN